MFNRIIVATICLISVLAAAKDFTSKKVEQKIVGGVEAREGEFPFMVSLQSGSHFCGGSLVARDWVLTAAHCVKGGGVDKIVIGLHSQKDQSRAEVFKPKQIISHPKYNSSNNDNDFALIQLDNTTSYQPISMNDEDIQIPNAGQGQIMSTTVGWGYLREGAWQISNTLQKVDVPLVSKTECNKQAAYNGRITDTMICAGLESGGKDSCQGDSGGPLLVQGANGSPVLVGVVSWGEGCARKNKYGVYSKVDSAMDWLRTTMR